MATIQNNKEMVPFEHYVALYGKLDPAEAAARCGVAFDSARGEFAIRLLYADYAISWPEFAIRSDNPGAFALGNLPAQMLLIRFLLEGRASKSSGTALFTAVVATAFAFEGWIIATSINAELKDAKKNLPRALVLGTLIVVGVYILYYIGLSGSVSNAALMESGETGARTAFETIFSRVGGTVLFVFVVISCLGTLNGLMLGCTRGMYALAARHRGPAPAIFKQVDGKTNMPTNSSVLGLLLCAFWLLYFYSAQLTTPWFGPICFDSSELPIVTIYALYIPIFFMAIRKEKELSPVKRFVAFPLAIAGSLFMIVAAIFAHKMNVVWYLLVFAVFMAVGWFFRKEKQL